jgi:hypothetical protein
VIAAVRAVLRRIACSLMTAEVDRAGAASRQNPAVVHLDAQNVVQAPDDRGEPYLVVVHTLMVCR